MEKLKQNIKNYFLLSEEEILEIKVKIQQRVGCLGYNPFTYYINNVVSAFENPYWFGSAVCDLIYWVENDKKIKYDLDIVGYYANEIGYCDRIEKSNDAMMMGLVAVLVPEGDENKFKYLNGLLTRYVRKQL